MPATNLLRSQPALHVDADGRRHSHSVHYKDEGGSKTSYTFDLNLLQREKEFCVGADLMCSNPKCAHATASKNFVGPHMFQVAKCTAIHLRGKGKSADPHMLNGNCGIGAWSKRRNAYTFCAETNCAAARLHCRFKTVNNTSKCKTCGAATHYAVSLLTDAKRTVTLAPVVVRSKRKIPVSMRKKSEKEIKEFILQRSREKRLSTCIKRKRALTTEAVETPKAGSAAKRVKKQHDAVNLTQCGSIVQAPHAYADAARGDLILQNEKLRAQNNKLQRENKELQNEVDFTRTSMDMLADYCRKELLKVRDNFFTILHHTNELTTAHNKMVAERELKFYDPYEDNAKIPIEFFAQIKHLPPLGEVTDKDFDFFD